jgi:N-acetyl-anhydromuramyl-L-alanine amidase AmpD
MCTVQVRKGGENLKIGDLVFRWNGLKPYYHVGIHIGNNQIIESKGRDDGVVQRDINASGSTYWNRIGTGLFEEKTEQRDLFLSKPMMRGEDVKALQVKLNELGYSCGEADGVYGKNTDGAVKAYLKDVQEAATQTDIVTPIVKKIMGVKT